MRFGPVRRSFAAWMRVLQCAALIACLACAALPAAAQAVQMNVRDGKVSLKADGASPRLILREWARLGGASIVNAEWISDVPVTLEVVDAPEWQVLDLLLHEVSGYVLTAKPQDSTTASRYARLSILPASAAGATRLVPPPPTPTLEAVPPSPVDTAPREELQSVPAVPSESELVDEKPVLTTVPTSPRPSGPDQPTVEKTTSLPRRRAGIPRPPPPR